MRKTKPSRVEIRVVHVGINYGCVGQLVAGNGRVIAETDCVPASCPGKAADDAVALAKTLGHTVVRVRT